METERFISFLPVYKTLSTFLVPHEYISKLKDHMLALNTVQKYSANVRAEQRITRAIQANHSPHAYYKLKSEDQVYAYSKSRKKWISGFESHRSRMKNIRASNCNRAFKLNDSQDMFQFDNNRENYDVLKLIKSFSQFKTIKVSGIDSTKFLSPKVKNK